MNRILLFLMLCTTTFFSNAQAPSGSVAYYPMDGNLLNSLSGGAPSVTGSPTAVTSSAGFANGAMHFSNTSTNSSVVTSYATTASNTVINFNSTTDFTVSINFKLTSTPLSNGAFGLYDNNLNSFGYGLWGWRPASTPTSPIQLNFSSKGGAVSTNTGTTTINLNTWYNVTGVRSGTSMLIYVNGVLANSALSGTGTPTYTITPRIATMSTSSMSPPQYNGLNGTLEELRIYNRALSAAEVATLSLVSLPLKLNNFTATLQQNKTQLNWQTSQEQNTSHFIVERSTDGQNFSAVQNINAAGNSNTIKNYSYSDNLSSVLLQNKTLFYRLKMVDIDQSFKMSKIIPIHLNQKELTINISPNPASSLLQIQTNGIGKGLTNFTIIDANGKVFFEKQENIQQATQVITISVIDLPTGSYVLKVANSSIQLAKTFIKSN